WDSSMLSKIVEKAVRDHAIDTVIAIADLALCYNNIEVFRCGVKTRLGKSKLRTELY
ncbi:hypothetical protein Tco_0358168, partial [Tanacetum coccineum]